MVDGSGKFSLVNTQVTIPKAGSFLSNWKINIMDQASILIQKMTLLFKDFFFPSLPPTESIFIFHLTLK